MSETCQLCQSTAKQFLSLAIPEKTEKKLVTEQTPERARTDLTFLSQRRMPEMPAQIKLLFSLIKIFY